MNTEPDDAITDGDDDDWCPECCGDDVIVLDDGTLFCRECQQVIDY